MADEAVLDSVAPVATPVAPELTATSQKPTKMDFYEKLSADAEAVGAEKVTKPVENKEPSVPIEKTEKDVKAPDTRPTIDELAKKKGWTDERKKQEFEWDRRVRVLTAQKKSQADAHARDMQEMRKQLQDLQDKIEGHGKEQPKAKRENFVSDEEWIDHRIKTGTEEITQKQMQDYQRQQTERQEQEQAQQAFRQNWTTIVESNFGSPEDKAEFIHLVQNTPDTLNKGIHEFIQNSDVGPRMLHAMLLRPDYVEALNKMPESVRTARLVQLETAIYTHLQGESEKQQATVQTTQPSVPIRQTAAQPQKASRAPAPIGSVGNSGSSASLSDQPDIDQVMAYKRKKFGA
jgi:hypothetical protein